MVSLCSASVGLTAGEATGLFEFSVQYLNTPTTFEVLLDLSSGQVKFACTDVIRAAVCGHKPEKLYPSVSFEMYDQTFVWYVECFNLYMRPTNKPVAT